MSRSMLSMLPALLVGGLGLFTVLVLESLPRAGEPTLTVFPSSWSANAVMAAAAASGVRIVSGGGHRLIVVAEDDGGFSRLHDHGAVISLNALGLGGCFRQVGPFGVK